MSSKPRKGVVGWREWVRIPEFSDVAVKAKVDTGARTSALHAFGLELERDGSVITACFEFHPLQRSSRESTRVRAEVIGFRQVRSSNGRSETRPLVRTPIEVGGVAWPADITLTSRDTMGFRMLLGRAAIARRFLVDPGRSYLQNPDPLGDHH
ncbi:MAG: ATP-dependent zinc protease [Microthrixaceae bacterium]